MLARFWNDSLRGSGAWEADELGTELPWKKKNRKVSTIHYYQKKTTSLVLKTVFFSLPPLFFSVTILVRLTSLKSIPCPDDQSSPNGWVC